ncbi:MAG: DUF697 domain-containing protein [Anaerolineae bacterium]|nr:DUF697 domain-containing protein [Anaerolineae bacterium]
MVDRKVADKIVRSHVIWSLGAGLIPVPLFDLAAVTAIQLDMLKQLANLYEADFSQAQGKAFVSALTGSTLAKIGSSLFKVIPGVGTVLGGLSMSALSGASTYAVGQVVITHLEASGQFLDVDLESAKAVYQEAFEQGKEFVLGLKGQEDAGKDVFVALEKLGKLKEQGVITAEEFEAKKQELLNRL